MSLCTEVMTRLTERFAPARDPARAVHQARYMRDQFPFLGIGTPALRALARQALAGLPAPDQAELAAIARACWARPEREYQQIACWYLRRNAGTCGPDFLPVAADLITDKSWWDTVDVLAVHLVGRLVGSYPTLAATMDRWIRDDNLWLARSALLHQLTYRDRTDAGRLFGYCELRAGHPDFFIRKAIGWALRSYSATDPEAVRSFVAGAQLSGLSRREALRNL